MEISDNFSDLPSADYFAYPLEWLDLFVNLTLNPSKSKIALIDEEQIVRMLEVLSLEETKLQLLIKKQTFEVTDEDSIRLTVWRYHSSLLTLLNTAHENDINTAKKYPQLRKVFRALSSTIENLLSFLEINYLKYLHMDLVVPSSYMASSRLDLMKKIDRLKELADTYENLRPLKNIVFEILYKFTIPANRNFEITFRSLFYNKELVRRLETVRWEGREAEVLDQLNEILFLMNFNSRGYIDYIIEMVRSKLADEKTPTGQLQLLHYYSKFFKQSHRRPGIMLDPDYHDLETVLQKWIDSEIKYMEEKAKLDESAIGQAQVRLKAQAAEVKAEDKIRCNLSSDQTGLILRAADEARILEARSMTEVFRSIVPYLSTPHSDNLSYNGMRSKSYVPEERDKEKAIEALERMIKKIRDY
ncbi:hypothetical protein [Flavobacterium lindanitolerans]|uniref:hypothetical protein n=1 Tax=Flavobacterium lindanitolerans TaxID=428988 RepID=UPI0023F4E06E|nr:hypothetical protein [Flavobacterium lindanitolerans]